MSEETSFGQWLKQRRKELDITQEELAEAIGCSHITIRKMEAGVRRPSRQLADLLANLLKVSSQEREAFISFARGVAGVADRTQPFLPGAASAQAPISAAGNINNILPAQLSSLIGREELVEEVVSRLLQDEVRLLTLTGSPGIGKTRIALQVALDLSWQVDVEDGIYFVPLAPISETGLVASAIAQNIGVRETEGASVEERLVQHLRDKRALLVLDNFEHIVEAAPAVADILQRCPGIQVLVTSREPLHVAGEQLIVVPPLQLPKSVHGSTVEALSRSPAVTLFVERAQTVKPDFVLTDQNGTTANAEAVAAICIGLEGLPLAIELAAARVRILTPQEIKAQLVSRLKLLSGGPRDAPARQQTVRGAIDWSFVLLTHDEQRLLARLSVFMGGFTLPTAEAVCNARGDLPFEVLDGIASLLDKSLLKREEVLGESHFTMLELIREYALEKLEQSGESNSIQRLHAEYFLALVEAAEVGLSGPEQPRLLARLEIEHPNIRAALRWAREKGAGMGAEAQEALDIGLRIGGAARHFWLLRSYYSQGREELQGLLSLSPQSTLSSYSKGARAKALGAAGRLAYRQGDYSAARSLFEESLAFRRETGDQPGIAWSLTHLAMAQVQQIVASGQENYSTARSLQEEGLALHKLLEDRWNIALSLEQLGILAYMDADYSRARTLFKESLALHKEQGQASSIGILLYQMGIVSYLEGDYYEAITRFRESLTHQSELGYKVGIALSLAGLGEVLEATGQPGRGATLMGASEALYELIGGAMEPTDRKSYLRAAASARWQLGDEEFKKAWQAGRSLSPEQAVSYGVEASS